jgi:hypothetical protein
MDTTTAKEDAIDSMRASRTDLFENHTHLQHSCRCLHVDIGGCDGS